MSELDRYSRQILLPEVGVAGQEQILTSAVAVVGCGALGSVIAGALVRASFYVYNTMGEVERFLETLDDIVRHKLL